MSKTVAELEQEVETLKQQMRELRELVGLDEDEAAVPAPDSGKSAFNSLYGIARGEGPGMSWEDWLEFKRELREAMERKFADLDEPNAART